MPAVFTRSSRRNKHPPVDAEERVRQYYLFTAAQDYLLGSPLIAFTEQRQSGLVPNR